MTPRILLLVLAALVLAVGAAGCGGDDDEADEPAAEETTENGGGGDATTLELVADAGGAPAFDTTSLEAPAGEITINLTNDSDVPHNVAIDGMDVVSETVAGGNASVTVTLEPGEYTYFCAVPGHREAGMEGTLTVQ